MLAEDRIKIQCYSKIQYYKEKGYGENKYDSVIEISPNDLPRTSAKKVKVKCDECGKVFERIWQYRVKSLERWGKDLCSSCARKGDRNNSYNQDRKELLEYARSFQKHESGVQKRTPEQKRKMSQARSDGIAEGRIRIHSHNWGEKTLYQSTKTNEKHYADSLLERLRMIQLDSDNKVVYWTKKHKIKILYKAKTGDFHYYIPDFKIIYSDGSVVIEEVKGRMTDDVKIKTKYANVFCNNKGYVYRLITQRELNENGEYRKFIRDFRKE